ncbi:MAG: tRNA preQ1(34) S-adenosylmethionine ribosyltransferase-isomerase QueA [Clostridia bacterium]|nr:tRNA preQ1(34) S-adenosylmethionine ribosyltransferase-isomerase QueA [Clostridia bacterium]
MTIDEFDYELPQELIAQTPLAQRDQSRLLVLHRTTGQLEHRHFYDIVDFLQPDDLLVVNDSKVIPARIFGTRVNTGGVVEVLMLKALEENVWEVLVKPGKKARPGQQLEFNGEMTGTVLEILEDGKRKIRFEHNGNSIYEVLDRIGKMPLPPYITEQLKDQNRYQTVYAKELGSAAAPTAGLHFTQEILERIRNKGVKVANVTLHVGLGTFRPVKETEITKHIMHSEYFSIPEETIRLIRETKKKGGRVISVGTTATRTLESGFDHDLNCVRSSGDTDIFIYPGYEFKVIDALITNFHLPKSTLVMLVSALAGREKVLNAYQEAVEQRYRFFSFGDAMFICD